MIAAAAFCAGCDWLQWGGGAGHAGLVAEGNIVKANVSALVSSTMSTNAPTGQVVAGHGLVFAARDGLLTAYDAPSYGVAWTAVLPAGTTAGGVPAVDLDRASNTVFVVVSGAANPILVGFDVDGLRNCDIVLNTCAPIFRADVGGANGPATPPVVADGKVFVNGGTRLYAFDASGRTGCASSQGVRSCLPLWSASTGFAARGVGPAVAKGVVYDAAQFGTIGFVGAYNEQNGTLQWLGFLGAPAATATPSIASSGTVFVPAGAAIAAFAGKGCGSGDCPRSYALVAKTGDAAGDFLATPAIDGPDIFATNGNGEVYAWSNSGCGSADCQPRTSMLVNAPSGGSTAYSESAAIENGIVFVLARRVAAAVDHVAVVALDEQDLTEVASWDLGVGDFGAGLASASLADGVLYAPTDAGLMTIHPRPVQPLASLAVSPLALSPSFSTSTFDYVLSCAAGTNAVTIDTAAVPGGSVRLVAPVVTQPSPMRSDAVNLTENAAVIVEATDAAGQSARYWVRCLPHDFPPVHVALHPESGSPTPGWYVTANIPVSGTNSYAMILDTNGTPVWYKRPSEGIALNVTPLGRNTLAFMSSAGAFSTDPNGKFDIFNLEKRQTSQLRTVGVPTDLHEFRRLPNGNTLLLSYPLKSGVDLTGLQATPTPGPNSTIADCEVQEVDPQGNLVFKWDASDHVDPVTETTMASSSIVGGKTVYDVYHCNSIDENVDGNLLVSARHLNAVFEIRRSDGKIAWKLGGKPVNKDNAQIITITNYSAGSLALQHDARYLPNGDVSVFDDQSFRGAAQAVEFAIDFTTGTARPVFQFASPHNESSVATGTFRRYSDGHSVVGWGIQTFTGINDALFSELDGSGNDVVDAAFGTGDAAYRVVKAPASRFDI
ncbi:MAG: hypothetical protein QOJ71_444, partial [Actinomycetota bacterium]|nr:hypothetical protein [Actinomycetota bacterium]